MESRALFVEEARYVVGCVFFGAARKATVEIGVAKSNAAVAEESFIMILSRISYHAISTEGDYMKPQDHQLNK